MLNKKIMIQKICTVSHMISMDISYISQSSPPLAFIVIWFILACLFKDLPKVSSLFLFSHMRRIQMVENRNHHLTELFLASHDPQQLVKTPSWKGIVFRENDHCDFGIFDRMIKLGTEWPANLDLVVFECMDQFLIQFL